MSENDGSFTKRIAIVNPHDLDLTDCCRICKCRDTSGTKLRPLFKGCRLTRIIANTIHIEIKDVPGLPRFLCEKCLNIMKAFSNFQVDFRRSEEEFKMVIDARKTYPMDSLEKFSTSIEMEKEHEDERKKAKIVTKLEKMRKKGYKSKSYSKNSKA